MRILDYQTAKGVINNVKSQIEQTAREVEATAKSRRTNGLDRYFISIIDAYVDSFRTVVTGSILEEVADRIDFIDPKLYYPNKNYVEYQETQRDLFDFLMNDLLSAIQEEMKKAEDDGDEPLEGEELENYRSQRKKARDRRYYLIGKGKVIPELPSLLGHPTKQDLLDLLSYMDFLW